MRLLSIPTPLATLLLLATTVTPSQAAIAAWSTDLGPQVILQNETTGLIQYSACNSDGSPAYSPTDNSTFSLDTAHKPRKDTPLAGAGYFDDHINATVASIYYIDENHNIANAVFTCNMATGLFDEGVGPWVVSGGAPSPLSADSGLAVILLGDKLGYRVYYHSEDMTVHELGYTQDDGWLYRGVISQDPQGAPAIAASWSGNANISVVTARDTDNMEVTRYNTDKTWHISTFPQPLEGNITTHETNGSNIKINATAESKFMLPSWTGNPGSLGISIDPKYTRSVWYIGNDKNLYWVANKNYTWSHQNSQPVDIWPAADSQNAHLAVAGDYLSGILRIYYMVNGELAEIKGDNGDWKKWAALSPPEPPKPDEPSSTPEPDTPKKEESGLSSSAEIGLGVGISVGVVVIGAIVAAVLVLRRKMANSGAGGEGGARGGISDAYKPIDPYQSSPSTQYSNYVPPPAGYDHYMWDKENRGQTVPPANTAGVYQLDAEVRPIELDNTQRRFELSDQTYTHELMVEGHVRRASQQ